MPLFSRRLTILACAALLGAGNAWAQPAAKSAPTRPAKSNSALPDSVRRVERQTGGAVLKAEPMQRDGREVYRLKVLTADGRVKVVQDDPQQRDARTRPEQQKPTSADTAPASPPDDAQSNH